MGTFGNIWEKLVKFVKNWEFLGLSELFPEVQKIMTTSLHSVTQHNIFEYALTPDDEDSNYSFGEIKLQTIQIYLIISTCKE